MALTYDAEIRCGLRSLVTTPLTPTCPHTKVRPVRERMLLVLDEVDDFLERDKLVFNVGSNHLDPNPNPDWSSTCAPTTLTLTLTLTGLQRALQQGLGVGLGVLQQDQCPRPRPATYQSMPRCIPSPPGVLQQGQRLRQTDARLLLRPQPRRLPQPALPGGGGELPSYHPSAPPTTACRARRRR